jgi:hypothetical protein
MLLCRPQAFFNCDVMTIEKTPERAAAARSPSLTHRRDELIQRSIRVLGNEIKDALGVVLQRGATTSARLRRAHSVIVPSLQPFDRELGLISKHLSRLTSRCTRFQRFDYPKVTRIRFRHRAAPPAKQYR